MSVFFVLLLIHLDSFFFNSKKSSYSKLVSTACVGNYWPVGNGAVTDVIGGKNATSSSPLFVADRFGSTNGSIRVNSVATAWQLPSAPYVQGDTTITLWLLKNTCVAWAPYGNNTIYLLVIAIRMVRISMV
jgi:hypothetical protein